ncbi:MAG: ABC transporter substrate-binding protein [Chelatococcus sp.]|nr:ABC transporter substrate-binding protein [Chelatococcus sp.]
MKTDYEAPFASSQFDRRSFLKATALTVAGGAVLSFGPARAAGQTPLRIQYDWLIGNGQLGDIVAQQKGFFKDEGLDVTFGPGGPNAQTVPPVLAGQAQLGQLSSTAQFFTAFEAGRPLMLFASGYRYSPYAYISLPGKPIRTPQDFIGKTVAINPNGRYLLDLVMAKNGSTRPTSSTPCRTCSSCVVCPAMFDRTTVPSSLQRQCANGS